MKFLIPISLILVGFLSLQVQAEGPPLLLWNDQEGFQLADSCSTEMLTSHFPFSSWPEDVEGVILYELPPLSFAEDLPLSLVGSEWKPYQEEGQWITLNCSQSGELRRHWIFKVYLPDSSQVHFYAAIDPEASSLFQELTTSEELPSLWTMGLDLVVCTSSSGLNVRDRSLDRILFQARRHEAVKRVQSWEENSQERQIGGVTYRFIEIEFPERNNSRGWVADEFIRFRSECPGAALPPESPGGDGQYTFPTTLRPTHNYMTGMRAFQASRGGGTRWHAAADLYRHLNDPIVAVTDGVIIRDLYSFYQGTYAIEVRHADGRIARYGEITSRRAPGIRLGAQVRTGQILGYIGRVNSGCCLPMLHFELYSGQGSGPLSVSGNRFRRRSDLMNPNQDLMRWERDTFGVSY